MKKIIFTLLLLLSFNVIASSNQFVILFKKNKIDLPSPPVYNCSQLSGVTPTKTIILNYNGSIGYDGSVQTITIPSNTQCVKFDVKGGGGGGYTNNYATANGGNGDFMSGVVDLRKNPYSFLYAVVSGHTTLVGGGGLSGIFSSSTPSQSSAIIVAGGGGGAGSTNGYNASLNPNQPNPYFSLGTMGAGGIRSNDPNCNGLITPFLNGTYNCYGTPGSFGAFGGGSIAGGYTGGGGGMPGGDAGTILSCSQTVTNACDYTPGGGGTSYCGSQLVSGSCSEKTGQGGQGGVGNTGGQSGSITVYFY